MKNDIIHRMLNDSRSNRWSAILKTILAVTAWGMTFVATKIALRDLIPEGVVWARFGIGIFVLGLVVVLRGEFRLPYTRDIIYFAFIGFIGITFHQWLQSTGLVTSQATTTAWIVATTPIFMALFGWLFLKEPLTLIQVGGIGIAALGVLLVVTRGEFSSLTRGILGAPGDLLILLSAPNWAVFSTLSRHGLRRYPSTLMMFYVMVFGWLFSGLIFLSRSGFDLLSSVRSDGWLAIVFLGIFGSGFAYIFWYDALTVLPVAQVGGFLYFEPFVTVVTAGILLQEKLTWASLVGGAGILAGVWLVTRPDRKRKFSKG